MLASALCLYGTHRPWMQEQRESKIKRDAERQQQELLAGSLGAEEEALDDDEEDGPASPIGACP